MLFRAFSGIIQHSSDLLHIAGFLGLVNDCRILWTIYKDFFGTEAVDSGRRFFQKDPSRLRVVDYALLSLWLNDDSHGSCFRGFTLSLRNFIGLVTKCLGNLKRTCDVVHIVFSIPQHMWMFLISVALSSKNCICVRS